MNEYLVSRRLRIAYPQLQPGPYPDCRDNNYWTNRPMLHWCDGRVDHRDPREAAALYRASLDWELITGHGEVVQKPMLKYKLSGVTSRHHDIAEKIKDELDALHPGRSAFTIFSPYDGSQDYRSHAYLRCGMSYPFGDDNDVEASTCEVVEIYQKYEQHFIGLTIELKETYARCFIEWKP